MALLARIVDDAIDVVGTWVFRKGRQSLRSAKAIATAKEHKAYTTASKSSFSRIDKYVLFLAKRTFLKLI